jgi:hypothetical protein
VKLWFQRPLAQERFGGGVVEGGGLNQRACCLGERAVRLLRYGKPMLDRRAVVKGLLLAPLGGCAVVSPPEVELTYVYLAF